jgi:hypothetical protein
MKNEGGREAGKCSKVVPESGSLFSVYFIMNPSSFLQRISFPVCRAQLIGDWYENRRGAQNTIIFLTIRQYYWRTDAPCANSNGGPNMKKIRET